MNKRIILGLVIALLAFGFVVSLPRYLPTARAATGLVCIQDPTSGGAAANPCPATSPALSGPVGNQIKVGIFIQGSDAMNGFDITLKADHTILKPIGVDLTGTVLPGTTSTPITECLSGIQVVGSSGCPATDTIDTIHFAATGGLGQITTPPTTGLLFTATYEITGTGTTAIDFQTGCGTGGSPTSVPPNVCITISNGSTAAVPESKQAGSFNNNTLPPYLTLSASPTTVTGSGTDKTVHITVTGANGWPPALGTDMITFRTSKPVTGITASISPGSCTPATTGCTPTLTISNPQSKTGTVTVYGDYTTVDSSGNTISLTATATVNVVTTGGGGGDFSVSAPTTLSLTQGTPGTLTVTVSGTAGFNGVVTLAQGVTAPPSGLTITFSPATVNLTPTAATQTSTATFTASQVGTFGTHITGTSGVTSRASGLITVTVTPSVTPGLTLSASPGSITTAVGTAGTAAITGVPTGGLTGSVALTSSVEGSPAGVTCTLSPAAITLPSGTSTLSCTSIVAGSFKADVNGSVGSTLAPVLVVPLTFTAVGGAKDFSLNASPASVNVNAGATGTSTVTITPVNGLTGTITLTTTTTPTTGLTCTLSPTSVTLGAAQTSTLSCQAASTASGSFTVDVAGANNTATRHTAVTFNVAAAGGFTLTATPTTVTCTPGQMATVTLTVAGAGFTGVVTLTPTVTPTTGLTASLSSTTITGAGTSTLNLTCTTVGSYTVNVAGTSGTLPVQNAMINVTVSSQGTPDFSVTTLPTAVQCTNSGTGTTGTSTVTVTAMNGFAQTVNLDATTLPPGVTGTLNPTSVTGSGTSTLSINCSGATTGTYTISVRGHSGYLEHSAQVTVTVSQAQDTGSFSLSAVPASLTCNLGAQTSALVTVTRTGAFTENVALTSPAQNGLTVTFSPATVTGGQGTSTVTVMCSTAGSYNILVTGTSATTSKTQTLTVPVTVSQGTQGTFAVTLVPSTVTFLAGSSGTSTVTVTPVGTFTGNVALSTSVSPSSGLTATLGESMINGGSGSTSLTFHSSTPGTYTVTVTGTSGSTTRTASVVVVVTAQGQGGFTVSASPSSLRVLQGCSNQTSITLASSGFAGTITLTSSVSPANAGVHADLSKVHVTLGMDKNSHLVLTVSADQNAAAGVYTVTVTGASGSTIQTVTVHVTVVHNSCTSNDTGGSTGCGTDDDEGSNCNAAIVGNDKSGNICKDDDEASGKNCLQHNDTDQNSCKTASDDDEAGETGCSCPNVTTGNENETGNNDNQQCNVNNQQLGQHETGDKNCNVTSGEDHGDKGGKECSANSNNQQVGQHETSDKNCGTSGQQGGNDNDNGCKATCKIGGNNDNGQTGEHGQKNNDNDKNCVSSCKTGNEDNQGKTGDQGNKGPNDNNDKNQGGCNITCGKDDNENRNHQAKSGDNNNENRSSDNKSHIICGGSDSQSGWNNEKLQLSSRLN